MPNQIERDVFVTKYTMKNPIHYVRGTDLLPIVFHFRDFSIPSGATARVFIAKPDGNAVYDSATIDGDDVTVDVTEQMFLVLGMTLMQISIFVGEEELVSFAQPVMVEQNLKAGDLPKSTTDVSFLDDAIEQANQAVNTATTAASQAAQAVQNANQAIADANEAISDLNEQIASLNTNFASLANGVNIPQLQTIAKTLVGGINELNSNMNKIRNFTILTYDNTNPNEYVKAGEIAYDAGAKLLLVYAIFDYGKPYGLMLKTKSGLIIEKKEYSDYNNNFGLSIIYYVYTNSPGSYEVWCKRTEAMGGKSSIAYTIIKLSGD